MTENDLLKIINEELKKRKMSNNFEESSKIFNVVTDVIRQQLSEGQEIKLRNIGTIKSVFRSFRKNIHDGQSETFQKWILRFMPSGTLTEKLNNNAKPS